MTGVIPFYAWRQRTYPWARAVIAAAEAVHGKPVPTCACGAPVVFSSAHVTGWCEACESTPYAAGAHLTHQPEITAERRRAITGSSPS